VDEYVTAEVLIVRIEPTADASLAAIRDRRRLGIAIAAMIRMIATTISNSISEKPFCFFIFNYLLESVRVFSARARGTIRQGRCHSARFEYLVQIIL
jgi:hypothetical protein